MNKINQTLSIALFPFKDLSFFHKDLIIERLNISNKNRLTENNKEIYNLLMNRIMTEFNIRNYDEITLIFDKYYDFIIDISKLNENDVYDKYLDITKKFTTCLISHRDGKLVYKHWKNQLDEEFLGPYDELKKVEIFHSISKMISMDIFAMMYFVMNNKDINQLYYFYSHISLADMQLDDILVKGVAENHLHANASFNFNLTWEQIVNERVDENIFNEIEFNHSANIEFKNAAFKYIKVAIIIRLLLSLYIKEQSYMGEYGFCEFIFSNESNNSNNNIKLNLISKLKYLFECIENNSLNKISISELNDILDIIKKNYSVISGDHDGDIVFLIFDECNGIKTYGENIYLFKCLEYMTNSEDVLFKHYFFQYIRIKNEFYQQVVQKKGINGLDNFQEFFQRGTKFIKKSQKSNKEFYKLMLRTIFQNEYLKKVELRFSIYDSDASFKKMIVQILSAYDEVIREDYIEMRKGEVSYNAEIPRLGLVFHLIKEKDRSSHNKCWMRFDEKEENSYNKISFKELQEKYKKQIQRLKKIRDEVPYLSYFILGIDAASLENNTPVEVFAPVYSIARDSEKDPLINFDSDGKVIRNKSLAFTFHAGEEFRHIVSGLRRIDEVVEHCKFHSGDRIGHGTALGIDIEKWISYNPVIVIPRGEYLNNLLWTWGVYTKSKEGNTRVSLYLEQEIYRIAKDIFKNMNGINTVILHDAYKERFKEFKKNNYNKEDLCDKDGILCIKVAESERTLWDVKKINHAYQCSCYLKYINEPIFIPVKEIDIEMIKDLQKYLIDILAEKGIIIEINPSSNAIIGEMSEIFENQAYAINKVEDINFNNVMISINSDDPMIFNTNISNEYAYMYYGLLDRGFGKEKALRWIEKLRVCGMETSFISNKLSDEQYYEYLCKVLVELGAKDY